MPTVKGAGQTCTDSHTQPSAQARTSVAGNSPRAIALAVRRAQAGDRDALGFLYASYADNVCGYIRSIVHDQHEAEDLTHTVFLKLARVIGSYREREVPFFAWLLRVARNVALDHLRTQRCTPVEEVRGASSNSVDPADSSQLQDLQDALGRLPQAQREVLVLRHVAGLSPVEIATLTGRSEGSVHGLHHRGRRALMAELTALGAAPSSSSVRRSAASTL
jgi:RNA polymerase sigma-70 factor (ECF subfamily)